MSIPLIADFAFDDRNEEKFAEHGITYLQVAQVLGNFYRIFPNRKHRVGAYLILGRDDSGRCIAVPIQATPDRLVWRPITAWYCKESEKARL